MVNEAILAEFHFTPDIYLKQFNTNKDPQENHVQFASRIGKYYSYYVHTRYVEGVLSDSHRRNQKEIYIICHSQISVSI